MFEEKIKQQVETIFSSGGMNDTHRFDARMILYTRMGTKSCHYWRLLVICRMKLYFPPTGAWDRPTLIGDHKKLAGALDVAKQPTRGYAITDLQARENGEALMRSLGME